MNFDQVFILIISLIYIDQTGRQFEIHYHWSDCTVKKLKYSITGRVEIQYQWMGRNTVSMDGQKYSINGRAEIQYQWTGRNTVSMDG